MSIKKCFLFLICISCIGCATRKEIVYFHGAEDLEGMENLMDYEPVIEPNDVLRINVSSMDERLVGPYQMNIGRQGAGGGQDASLTGYLVDPDGYINFPQLGKVKVAGLTRSEIEEMLQSRIRQFVTDAIVNLRILNFRVTVLGEVGSPGRVEITDGRVTVPELLAMAGDINYTGKRQNILVIREEEGIRSVGRVDMTTADIFSNPYYYLKQNDIVYVEPTYRQVKTAGFITSWQGLLSIFTTAFSLYILFTR